MTAHSPRAGYGTAPAAPGRGRSAHEACRSRSKPTLQSACSNATLLRRVCPRGRRYVALLTRPGMAALFRIVIAELPRFPELGEAHFERGKMPYFDSVRRYLDTENALGTAKLDDTELAATQFLGMISNYVFWPRMLLMNWSPDDASMAHVVDEAVLMMEARYGLANTTD
ncbi:TetR/AcrR family transcriptional regulator C-terminal domain-containing protein [Amycolatopsis regifaucium]|uniref:TetR/AcrR family transcriptional regulator C-terminal domain-containing protein n=1 Tax=Amycolatopsis regifaucium TaxID=546365 RepID=UPI00244A0E8F|nr:TetR/AcrR family transcriptional regulator C-terminal domain-containing protein [Amycolatopsis regifaucium]